MYLTHTEIVTHQQTLLHRGSWDFVHLEDVGIDDRGDHHRKDDSLHPPHQLAEAFVLILLLFVGLPEEAIEQFGDVEVEDDGQTQQHPQVATPHHKPKGVDDGNDRKLKPTVFQKFHISFC